MAGCRERSSVLYRRTVRRSDAGEGRSGRRRRNFTSRRSRKEWCMRRRAAFLIVLPAWLRPLRHAPRGRPPPERRCRSRRRAAAAETLSPDQIERFLTTARSSRRQADWQGRDQPVAADAVGRHADPRRRLSVGRSRARERPLQGRPRGEAVSRLLRLQHRRLPARARCSATTISVPVSVERTLEGQQGRAHLVGRQEVGRGRAAQGGNRAARPRRLGAADLSARASSPRSSRTPTAISATSS